MKTTHKIAAIATLSTLISGCETMIVPVATDTYYYDDSDVSVVTTDSYYTYYPYNVNFTYSTYPVYSYPAYRYYRYPGYWNGGVYYHPRYHVYYGRTTGFVGVGIHH